MPHATYGSIGGQLVSVASADRSRTESDEGSYHNILHDRGCWAAPKCLACPLPKCTLDMTTREKADLRFERRNGVTVAQAVEDARRRHDQTRGAHSAEALAARYGVAERTMQRWLSGSTVPTGGAAC